MFQLMNGKQNIEIDTSKMVKSLQSSFVYCQQRVEHSCQMPGVSLDYNIIDSAVAV